MWPIHLAFLHYIAKKAILSFSSPRNTSSFFTDRSKWPPPSLLSPTSQKFQGIPDSFNEVPKFQRHTKLCSNYSTLLVPSLNWNPIRLWKDSSSCWCCFAMANLNAISPVHLAPLVTSLNYKLKHSTFSSCFWSIIICAENVLVKFSLLPVFHIPLHSVSSCNFIQLTNDALQQRLVLSQLRKVTC
jgi:hypothetical protein